MEEKARNTNGVLESPMAEKIPVAKEKKGKPQHIDQKIQPGIRHDLCRRMDQSQHKIAAQNAAHHKQKT